MAFNPALTSATDRVRFDVGDYNDAAPIIPEAVYTATLARYGADEARATVAMAEALIVRVAQDPDKVEVTGAVKVEWSQRIAAWRALANGLRATLGLPLVGAAAGGDTTMRIGQLTRGGAVASEYGG